MSGYVSYYKKSKVIPLIINLFKKEGIYLEENLIKSWDMPVMRVTDVILGINYAKTHNSNIIVYTNKVVLKEKLHKDYGVKIYDNSDLKELAIKHGEYELYDEL